MLVFLHAMNCSRVPAVRRRAPSKFSQRLSGVTPERLDPSQPLEIEMANKQELLHFLDQHVFNPILKASQKIHSDKDARKLKDVQDRTRSERERFHHYSSAREIVDNYKSDLHSKTGHRVNQELESLGLPTLPSIKDEFLKLAGDGGQ
jgi:hypothetical protein